MKSIRLKTCFINTIEDMKSFAYLTDLGGKEIIVLRSELDRAALSGDETVQVAGVLRDPEAGHPSWHVALDLSCDPPAWASGFSPDETLSVARDDIRHAIILCACSEIISLAERAMDWSGDYAHHVQSLTNVKATLGALPVHPLGKS